MLVRIAQFTDVSSLDLPSVGGDPAWLRCDTIYYAHALGIDSHNEAFVCLREPEEHPFFPYFYYIQYFDIIDSSIPNGYELAVYPPDATHRYLLAPSFWARDPMFYEELSNAPINETRGVVGIFLEHVARVGKTLSSDIVV